MARIHEIIKSALREYPDYPEQPHRDYVYSYVSRKHTKTDAWPLVELAIENQYRNQVLDWEKESFDPHPETDENRQDSGGEHIDPVDKRRQVLQGMIRVPEPAGSVYVKWIYATVEQIDLWATYRERRAKGLLNSAGRGRRVISFLESHGVSSLDKLDEATRDKGLASGMIPEDLDSDV